MDESQKQQKRPDGRILGIDFGEKRIGMALSDPLFLTAQGLKTITCDNRRTHFAEIAEIVKAQKVALIIIGMPYDLSGSEGDAAKKVRAFADELQHFIAVPVEFLDERFTTVAAKRALIEMGVKTGRNKALIDRTSAILLLQQYLDTLAR